MNRIIFTTVAFLLICSLPVFGQGSITVTGSATSYNLPTKAQMVVYVSKLEKEADDAFDETADDVEDIVQEMQEMKNVTDISISDVRVEPVYDRVNMRYGFRSYQEVSITIDSLAIYEEVLDDLLGSGADGIAKASTMGNNQGTVDMDLLKEAVRDARAKAENLASAENMKVGKVISLEVLEADDDKSSISVEKGVAYTGLNANKRVNSAEVKVTFALN